MNRFIPNRTPCGRTRREFLWQAGGGFAGLALADLMATEAMAASPLAERLPHFAAKAKHCVFLFMNGGPSQVDTFDPKPALTKYHGKPYRGDAKVGSNGRAVGHLMQSPFKFRKHGRSGLEISSLFPHTARHADDLCVIRSMHSDTAAHASGLPADELRQHFHRQALPRFVAELRAGHPEPEPARLRRDDRPARRSHWQRLELVGRIHAGGVSGHFVSQRRFAVARPGHTRGHGGPDATAQPRPAESH